MAIQLGTARRRRDDSGDGGTDTPSYYQPDGPTIPYKDPQIPDQTPTYHQPTGPTYPTHGGQIPGQPGARSGINPRPSMPQPQQGGYDFSTPDGVRAYFQSRGVTPYDSSPDYWARKWQEFGRNDPEYYQRFLSNAEEFTGGAAQTARAMGWQPRASGGSQSGGLGAILQLLQSRLPQMQTQAGPAPAAQTATTDQTGGGDTQQRQPVDIDQIVRQALGRAW